MGWRATVRALEVEERRLQRDAKKRQRELARQTKEQAKLTALEQARLEVETYENGLDVLLSVHKEQSAPCDWAAISASLPPVAPQRIPHHEFKARQRLAVAPNAGDPEILVARAREQDELSFQADLQTHGREMAEWEQMTALARRVLTGEARAYLDALEHLNPFAELSGVGTSLHFTVHTPRLIECVLGGNGRHAVPAEVKTLTAAGKVSVKAMPKARFSEIYQDYVCACVLRVTREVMALLPIDALIVTATVQAVDSATGADVELPILSAAFTREVLAGWNFERLDPSDSVMNVPHRGEVKVARKTGAFEFITPLAPADLPQQATDRADPDALFRAAQELRHQIDVEIEQLAGHREGAPPNGEP